MYCHPIEIQSRRLERSKWVCEARLFFGLPGCPGKFVPFFGDSARASNWDLITCFVKLDTLWTFALKILFFVFRFFGHDSWRRYSSFTLGRTLWPFPFFDCVDEWWFLVAGPFSLGNATFDFVFYSIKRSYHPFTYSFGSFPCQPGHFTCNVSLLQQNASSSQNCVALKTDDSCVMLCFVSYSSVFVFLFFFLLLLFFIFSFFLCFLFCFFYCWSPDSYETTEHGCCFQFNIYPCHEFMYGASAVVRYFGVVDLLFGGLVKWKEAPKIVHIIIFTYHVSMYDVFHPSHRQWTLWFRRSISQVWMMTLGCMGMMMVTLKNTWTITHVANLWTLRWLRKVG